MDIAVPSRFACLNVEDEDFRTVSSKKKPQEKPTKQILANKKTTNKQNGKKTKVKAKNETKQWEEWKKKDEELVNDHFHQDLKSALLQSKMSTMELQKKFFANATDNNGQIKKKKVKTMSLHDFLNNSDDHAAKENETQKPTEKDDKDFFKDFIESAEKEITKDVVERKRKERERNIDEVISLAQCQEKLKEAVLKNIALEEQLDKARDEITIVKKRNSTLCSMLIQGEMKDKAAVLVDLERISRDKEELTEEVSKLHKLLEQERSKANVANDPHTGKGKDKKHKFK